MKSQEIIDMPAEYTFNLAEFKTSPTSRVFSGRPRGEECRRLMKLDEHDAAGDHVSVIIPRDIFSINMSFFLAVFGASVQHYKTSESFYAHYSFEGPAVHLKAIGAYVQEALQSSIALPHLKRAV